MSLFNQKKEQINENKSLPNHKNKSHLSGKMTVQKEAPRFTCGASFTVEAALVIPMVTCFFAAILFLFHVLEVQLCVQTGMEQTGRKLAVYAAAETENGTDAAAGKENGAGAAAETATAKILLVKNLRENEEIAKWVVGGAAGLSLLESDMEGDDIDLVVNYRMEFPLRLLQPFSVHIKQRTKVRKWTGWNPGAGEDEDPWVYITESGSVYHTTKNCTHLKLSIQPVSLAELAGRRNLDGAIYHACPQCVGKEKAAGIVYITDYGDRYHTNLNCSGLKRTIYTVRKSEVGNRRACSKCGGGE